MMEKTQLSKGDIITITNEFLNNFNTDLVVEQNIIEDEVVIVEEAYGSTLLYFYEDFEITNRK